ncbi:MAG: hypothetical protein ACLFR2_04665 [Candidatus Kapaibacterium sp.]
MKVSPFDAYTRPYVNDPADSVLKQAGKIRSKNAAAENHASMVNIEAHNSEEMLSKKERDFFIKLFPENSTQIERHTLFNRNGRTQDADINKGMLVDSRI